MGWSGSVAGGATLLAGGVLILFDDQPGQLTLAVLLGVAALCWWCWRSAHWRQPPVRNACLKWKSNKQLIP